MGGDLQPPLRGGGIFEIQDDVVPCIVSTVADWYGILPRSMSEAVRSRPVEDLSPYEALLRAFGYYSRVTPEEHATVRPILERAVEKAPGHAAGDAAALPGSEHRPAQPVRPGLGAERQRARAVEGVLGGAGRAKVKGAGARPTSLDGSSTPCRRRGARLRRSSRWGLRSAPGNRLLSPAGSGLRSWTKRCINPA
ncbi:MAG: hypothetical protein U0599_16830 [Vicinamibacteria bacterium]